MKKKYNEEATKATEETLEKNLDTVENKENTVENKEDTVEDKEASTEENEVDTEESDVDTEESDVDTEENEADTEESDVDTEESDVDTEENEADTVDEVSNDAVEKENDIKNNKFNAHDLVWITIGLVIGILLSYCIFNITLSSAIQKLTSDTQTTTSVVDKVQESGDEITGVSTYDDPSVIINDKDNIENAQEIMLNYINGITDGNTYSQVMTGEDQYVYYMYNSKGEIFTQDINATSTEVFLNNNRVFKYNTDAQTLSVGSDIDVASILKNAVMAIGKDNVTLYEMDLSGIDTYKGHEYRIDLVGADAVKLLYNSVGDEFATDMVNSITASINDWEPHIIMVMFIGDNEEDSYCYCLYVIDNSEYTNWFFQGYDTVDEWALVEDWYAYDEESDENGEKYSALMNDLVENINNIMTNYAYSNGWLTTEEIASEVVENVEEATEVTEETTEVTEETTEVTDETTEVTESNN